MNIYIITIFIDSFMNFLARFIESITQSLVLRILKLLAFIKQNESPKLYFHVIIDSFESIKKLYHLAAQ